MKTKILIVIIFFSLFAFVRDSFAYGDYQELEITNIKPAGTGDPAISEYNRIFRAYPGIEYSVPVGIIGGTYPFVFSLSNAPSGMTIDNHTGVITWTNPQSSASDISVTVHDKNGHSVSATWSITVTNSTNDFIFVDSSYSGTETGSITQPYNSIQDILDLGSEAVNKIVYFREGTYGVPQYNGIRTNGNGCNLVGRAHIWIGYPDEDVAFNMRGVNDVYADWFEAYIPGGLDNIWFENIKLQSPIRWGWIVIAENYFTFYKMTVDGLSGVVATLPGNPGAISSFAGNDYYMYVTDSIFTNFLTAHHLGSFYGVNKLLIERNTFRGTDGNAASLSIKADNLYVTVRKNQFINVARVCGDPNNAVFSNSYYNEICYNYMDSPTGRFNVFDGPSHNATGTTWFYRNTVTDRIEFVNLDYPDECEGPWHFSNNIMQNSDSGIYHNALSGEPGYTTTGDGYLCINDTENYKAISDLVGNDGLLINRTYVGTYGWEIAESEYWNGEESDAIAPSSPTGLSAN